ncbi:MAG: SH3 domain-containing protein [Anaerolineae bacterium]|nr:SH3 domain-containing protein [Anaerolineae bacterium]
MRRPGYRSLGLLLLLGATLAMLAACAAPSRSPSPQEREAQVLTIAKDYATTQDLARAQARLEQLGLPNSRQYVALLAEQYIREERDGELVVSLVGLARDLGMETEAIVRYIATAFPEPAEPTPAEAMKAAGSQVASQSTEAAPEMSAKAQAAVEATATPGALLVAAAATDTPTATETATEVPPTDTPVPPTATPMPPSATPTPIPSPFALAITEANVRLGPGTTYQVMGALKKNALLQIVGRNPAGDWWQVCCINGKQGWIAASVVEEGGRLQDVNVAANIPPSPTPTPRATPTPKMTPTPAPPTEAPRPAVAYRVKSVRLRPINQDAQRCNAGDHYIMALVVDPAGNRLDGVRVREIFSGQIHVTGAQGKGPGRVEWDIYRGGGGQLDIMDEGGNRLSEVTRGMSADWPDFDLIRDAGYCTCKPHPDDATCKAELESHQYLFAVGHYVYEVVFERTY